MQLMYRKAQKIPLLFLWFQESLTCPYCAKISTTKSNLKSHVQLVHLQIAKYSCTLCGRKFKRKPELQMHQVKGCK